MRGAAIERPTHPRRIRDPTRAERQPPRDRMMLRDHHRTYPRRANRDTDLRTSVAAKLPK